VEQKKKKKKKGDNKTNTKLKTPKQPIKKKPTHKKDKKTKIRQDHRTDLALYYLQDATY